MRRDLLVVVFGLVALGLVWAAWSAFSLSQGGGVRPFPVGPVVCTQDAKLCPDGSYVARTGPKCEFALCPSSSEQASYKDATYTIDSVPHRLDDGATKYFGNEATGDLNGDGQDDVAFLITYDGGGSGTFYYAVAALKSDGGYTGTNAIFLGDRVAPQTTEVKDGRVIVNYVDRKSTDPMTAPPSVGVSKYLKVSEGALVEVQ